LFLVIPAPAYQYDAAMACVDPIDNPQNRCAKCGRMPLGFREERGE